MKPSLSPADLRDEIAFWTRSENMPREKQMRTLRNMVVSLLVFAPIVAAQLHVGGLTTDPGAPVDFSASTVTTPTAVGTSLPGTCTVGQQFFKSNNSAGTELYLCTATNTWTQVTGGGGGGMIDPGANGVMKRTALNTTAAATATDVSALNYVAGSGTAQAQAVTLPTPITALTNGLNVCWLPAAANTAAAPTLAVNGLAAKPLTKYGTAPLVANDLTTTAIACAMYDGAEFQLQNPQTLPVFVKINGGAPVGPQATLNLIPGTGLAGFTGVVNGSQIDVTLPVDTSYLNTNYPRLAAANTYSGGALQDMNAVDLRLPVHSSDPGVCTVGQIEFNSTAPTFKGCSTTNTWSALGGAAAGYTYTAVSFSATPTFTFGAGVNTFEITLTGNVTSSTVAAAVAGQPATFVICQDATGSRTFAWPAGFHGATTIGSTSSKCNTQTFTFDGTSYWATAAGVINQ